MRSWTIVGLLLLTILWPALTSSIAVGQHLEEEQIRVLLITGGHGFEQEPFFAMFDSMADVKTTTVEYPAAAQWLKPELSNDFDVIVFYDMWAKGMALQQQEAFVELLNRGIGVVALHHTLAAHQDWPEYAKIIGGKYHVKPRVVDGKTLPPSGYAHDQDIQVRVAEGGHPITAGLQDFEIHDETYNRYDVDAGATVLLTTEHPQSNSQLAWVKTYGQSRVFYLQLGHDHLAYENPTFFTLVARGIRWAAGRPTDVAVAKTELFNGKDLSGWTPEGGAKWEVQNGLLIGQQGDNNAPGDLLTDQSFDDFELKVTFQVQWPANSGVWYRYQSAQQAYQADILEYKEPFALTGTLYCTGKMFIAVNEDPKLVDRDGWNELVIRAVGNRQVVLLNGTKVADVRDETSDRGRIGFQVHAGKQFATMQIRVKEVSIRPI